MISGPIHLRIIMNNGFSEKNRNLYFSERRRRRKGRHEIKLEDLWLL